MSLWLARDCAHLPQGQHPACVWQDAARPHWPYAVAEWFDAVSKEKHGAANRVLEIPCAMMFSAEYWEPLERDTNPCLGIEMNPTKRVARFLDAN